MNNNLQTLNNMQQDTITSIKLVNIINKYRQEENLTLKRHDVLLRDIRNEISKSGNKKYFIKSSYLDIQNQKRPCYILTKNGVTKLMNGLRMTSDVAKTIEYLQSIGMYSNTIEVVDNRKEIEFLTQLEQTLEPFGIKGESQYSVDKYRIDYYIKDMNVAIEYDENDHNHYTYEQHELRQQIIEKQLGCKFIRVSDSKSHAYNVGIVIKELFNI